MKRFAIVVSLFCGACLGTIGGSGQSGEGDDEPQDEPTPTPPVTVVEITVRGLGGPIAGLPVVFMKADDSVVADVVTDAQGIASANMPDGGSVTVVRPGTPPSGSSMPDPTNGGGPNESEGSLAQVYTYVSVKPGDKLQLVTTDPVNATPVTARVMVPMTEELKPLAVITPCGSGQGIAPYIDVTLTGCGTDTDFYVVDLAENLSFLKRAPIAATVDLSTEMLRDSLSTTLSATNTPMGSSVALEARLETDRFRPLYSSGALSLGGEAGDATGNLTTNTTVSIPNLTATEQHVSAVIGTSDGTQIITSRAGYGQADLAIDVGPHLIKMPSAATIAADTVSWTELGMGTPDLVLATVRDETMVRTIVAAYGSTSLRVPRLPAAHDAYNLQTTDSPSVSLAKVGGGYDAARARVFAGPLAPMNGYATIALPAFSGMGTDLDPTKP